VSAQERAEALIAYGFREGAAIVFTAPAAVADLGWTSVQTLYQTASYIREGLGSRSAWQLVNLPDGLCWPHAWQFTNDPDLIEEWRRRHARDGQTRAQTGSWVLASQVRATPNGRTAAGRRARRLAAKQAALRDGYADLLR
jgi:hypothetical protein